MSFQKLGLVYRAADHVQPWAQNSALTPTPVLHPDGFIRVFAGFRDAAGTSRIGFVDVSASDPRQVLAVSSRPALDVGRAGCFDDNGVILGDVVLHEGRLHLFYVGFQLVAKAKFLAFSGLAVSDDWGLSFQRVSEAPILDRGPGQTTIGAIHSAHYENGRWRLWYARGDGWEIINGTPYPQYEICHVEAQDLLEIPRQGTLCVPVTPPEYRIGRPRVYRDGKGYVLYYTKGTTQGDYFPGKAYSADGLHWERRDETFELALGSEGWDAQHLCYPAFIQAGDREYVFYNGNNMGVDGFGVAVRPLRPA
ncbi:MAG TPA: hypothetical protein VF050_06910 [Moraxellaceae bacterium]